METKIVIAGDVVVSDSHADELKTSVVDEELAKIIKDSDYSIVNFEAPVKTKYSKPIIKSGSNLSQSAEVIDLMKQVGFRCFTLANNHFRDFGHDACENTLVLLQAKCIDTVGGGNSIIEASKILYRDIQGTKVAFINVCEKEWSIATEERAGSNPLHPLTQYNQIKEASSKADFVILVFHGGVEHYNLPSPEIKQLHRFFIEAGADAVINHHQHCFSGIEVYKGRPIFYGIGNFLFDDSKKKESLWNYGYIVELKLNKETHSVNFDIHPYEQCNPKFGVYFRRDKSVFLAEIEELNNVIQDDVQLKNKWKAFETSQRSFYNPAMIPYSNRVLRKLHSMNLLPSFISKYQLCYLYDVINCDSHRVRFLEFLESKIYK